MELPSRNARAHLFSPAVPCAQCGVTIPAPEWSEPFDPCRVRHLWTCNFCGYEFETTVFYPVRDAQAA